ncbi:hypothetical protein FKP32DRAFT_1596215 [Trametes sanguinea]|nr:hypothetical protein FKP32DRAFT_1596215 [Trametes sanguinea]
MANDNYLKESQGNRTCCWNTERGGIQVLGSGLCSNLKSRRSYEWRRRLRHPPLIAAARILRIVPLLLLLLHLHEHIPYLPDLAVHLVDVVLFQASIPSTICACRHCSAST